MRLPRALRALAMTVMGKLIIAVFLSAPLWATTYEVDPQRGEIWAYSEGEKDTWESLIKEWKWLLDAEKIKGQEGPLPKKVALHDFLHPFIRQWQGKRVDPTVAQGREMKHKIVAAPNCFSAVLSLYDPKWQPAYIDWQNDECEDFEERLGSLAILFEKKRSLSIKNGEIYGEDLKDLKPGDILLFHYTTRRLFKDIDDNGEKTATWTTHKSVEHAATYLINGFVFEKRNWQFDSPYEIITLEESLKRHEGKWTSSWNTTLDAIEVLRPTDN